MLDDEKPEPKDPTAPPEIVYINMPAELIVFARFWQSVTRDRIVCSQHGNFAGSCFELHHPELLERKNEQENVGRSTHG